MPDQRPYPKQIWRYAIPATSYGEDFSVEIPRDYGFVHVDVKRDGPFPQAHLWCEVDPDTPLKPVTFHVVSTGQEYDSARYMYLGTFNMNDWIFHLLKAVP